MKLKPEFIKLKPEQRLYQLPIPIIGLTGGIATGKTTVAKMLIEQGIPVINADHLVKEIYTYPETISFIQTQFPQILKDDQVQFHFLRERVFTDPVAKKQVEDFIYQRLPEAFMRDFAKIKDPEVVIYDIPLLFEKKLQSFFDLNVLVYAPRATQIERLVKRDKHDQKLAEKILDHQMDIEEKKSKAEIVIENSLTEDELKEKVGLFINKVFSY